MTNNRKINVKKSQFNASTTIPGQATLDYVSQNTNLKITFADFIANLGVTGTIGQVGDPGGVPVLDVQGAFNGIRNVEPGPGISASVSPQNGLVISSSFTFDTTGVALVDNPSAPNPAFRSLLEGPGIDISESTGTITLTADTSDLTPANRVLINSPNDFPSPVAGLITLQANTEYYIGDNITIPGSFAPLPNNVVFTGQREISSLTYAGTNTLFPGTDVNTFTISGLSIDTPSAQVFDFTDTTPQSTISINNCSFTNATSLGQFTGISDLIVDLVGATSIQKGFSFIGNINVLSLERILMQSANVAFKGIDLTTAVISSLAIGRVVMIAPGGAFGISGLAANGNITPDSIASVASCDFSGGMTALENITTDDIRWRFEANTPIQDTFINALASIKGNATVTVITTINTPVVYAGTFTSNSASHFAISAAGRITYNGERDAIRAVTASLTVRADSGTNKLITSYFALNGVVITDSGMQIRADATETRSITLTWLQKFSKDDYIELWAENNTDTADAVLVDATFRVS